jgi:glutamine synthetase
MSHLAERSGLHTDAREAACRQLLALIEASGVEQVRIGWCDLHGVVRGKTLVASALRSALYKGIGMVSTLLLKDSSDRTAFKVFEQGIESQLPGFSGARNLLLLPDPASWHVLPWAERTGWLQGQPFFEDGRAVPLDTRHVLQQALSALAQQGLGLRCGLEVEFHIYRLQDALHGDDLDPTRAAWPGPAPQVSMVHPGYNLLTEAWMDRTDEPLRIVQRTAQALGLPLSSLEIELGPSQVEAVFEVSDALTAADNMVLFRNAVKQALRRAGYHATFMCRPPFEHIMSSGWHLHQSLIDLASGAHVFMRDTPQPGSTALQASHVLSDRGQHYLAGLLEHAPGMTALCTSTANGYGRFRPHAMAPQSILWGLDNRGAMLRVIGQAGDSATRIENRLGEPAANPYLYMASQIHAGLDGLRRQLDPGPASQTPYACGAASIPLSLADAVSALERDEVLCQGLGSDFVAYYAQIKRSEHQRLAQAEDAQEFQRREYFARI